ncbi:MAG TPA: lipid-A-disaccharide synthase [Terriglobales bacterium]|nr:lipid-A-disaccharide synthase [Terriglobales bacterium]
MRILISAGEASGEMYGAQLIQALRRQFGQVGPGPLARVGTGALARPAVRSAASSSDSQLEFFGVGGEKMRAAGCDIVVDAKDLSVVGITEILSHLPKIWRLFHKLIAEADKRRPDLAVVIDSPAFNWRAARQMKKRGVPVVYYVCPQFWAWRQGRVRLLRKYVDKALVIFPFEEKFYRDRGVNAEFVGHPLAELPRPAISREQYAADHELIAAKPWITLMPGSRVKEVRMNLPGILEAAALLGSEYEFLIPVAPTLASGFIQGVVDSHPLLAKAARIVAPTGEQAAGEHSSLTRMRTSAPTRASSVHLVPEALPALAHSRAGIIASGTATVEAAMMETPFVMVYRVTPLTYLLGRWTVKVPHFAMVNLIAGEEVVPELVQNDFTAERIAAELKQIIPDGKPREKMIDGLRRVKRSLRGNVEGNAPEHAAKAIADLLSTRASRAK